jgi:hypothetical protein
VQAAAVSSVHAVQEPESTEVTAEKSTLALQVSRPASAPTAVQAPPL